MICEDFRRKMNLFEVDSIAILGLEEISEMRSYIHCGFTDKMG
jgi:hypothetical protein